MVRMPMPPINRRTARIQPPLAAFSSMSGSALPLSSGCSRAVRISQTELITNARSRASPACQVTRPAEAIPHTAAETAIRRGTSRRTSRLSTRRGITRALLPSTTITLKMLLPTTLLTARVSNPWDTELRVTNNSGALVPSDTTVRPITSWGMPKINDKVTAPCTKISPPPNSRAIPTRTSRNADRNGGIAT